MTQPPRSITEFLAALANASRPHEPAPFTIQPGDFKAIARLMAVAEWLKTDNRARAFFEAFERARGSKEGRR